MTWTLAHTSSTITSDNTISGPMFNFWDHFYRTFLTSKGWTVITPVDNTGSYKYYLCKKSFVQANGIEMRWCFIHRLYTTNGSVRQDVMPWDTSEAVVTGSIHSEDIGSSGYIGMNIAKREGQHLQIWQSDVHTDAFFIKTREPDQAGGVFIATHFPDVWHFCDPAFGTNISPDADVSPAPIWFDSVSRWRYQDYTDWDAYACSFQKPEYFTQRMDENQYLTNKLVVKNSQFNLLKGTAEDILFRNNKSGIMGNASWQAISYEGTNYVDVAFDSSSGWMFDVDQVDPQTGV